MSWLFITDLAEPGDMPDCAARLRAGCLSSRVFSLPRRDEQRHLLADMAHPPSRRRNAVLRPVRRI